MQLFRMLDQTNARLDALEIKSKDDHRIGQSTVSPDSEEEMAARAALHKLLFPDVPFDGSGFGNRQQSPTPRVTSGTATARSYGGILPEWGSSVEIPDGNSVPTAPIGAMPTIRVQPPTAEHTNANPSQKDSSVAPTVKPLSLHSKMSQGGNSTIKASNQPRVSVPPPQRMSQMPYQQTMGQPAPVPFGGHQDPLMPTLPTPRPWDLITQRLYSWALVWPPEDFVRSLEATALGLQVDEFALTIYTMVIFKRYALMSLGRLLRGNG